MDSSEIRQLQILAAKARQGAVLGTYHAKSGHPGGSLSAADIFTYLYYKEMNVDPANPDWEDRDRFVLSKGHCCPSLYAVLALKGYFAWEELTVLRHIGAMLQGHPDMKSRAQGLLRVGGADRAASHRRNAAGSPRYEKNPRYRHEHRFSRTGYFRSVRYGACGEA